MDILFVDMLFIIGHWYLDTLCDNLYVDNDVFLDKLLWICWVQIVTCGQPV